MDMLDNNLPDQVEFEAFVNKALYSLIDGSDVEQGKNVIELAKKVIALHVKKGGYENIDSKAYIDILDLIKNELEKNNAILKERLPGFDFSLLTDKEKLSKYIDNLINGRNCDELEDIYDNLGYVHEIINYLMFSAKTFIEQNLYLLLFNAIDQKQNDNYISTVFDEPSNDKGLYSEEELTDFLRKINLFSELQPIAYNLSLERTKIGELYNKKLLEWFHSDQDFIDRLSIMLKHNGNQSSFYFHGTQNLDDAPSIMNLGLGMTQDSLNSTAVKELDINQVLLYRYGKKIGKDAIVIIDVPNDNSGREVNIVEKKDDNVSIPFTPSGNQGLTGKPEYIVDSKFIVGYVDKKSRKVIFNPNYIHYDLFEDIDKKKSI